MRLYHRRPLVVLTEGHLPERLDGNEPGDVLLGMCGQEMQNESQDGRQGGGEGSSAKNGLGDAVPPSTRGTFRRLGPACRGSGSPARAAASPAHHSVPSLGDPADPSASSDDTAPVGVQDGGRRAAAVAGNGRREHPRHGCQVCPPGFLTGCDFALLSERRQILPAPRSLAPSCGRSRHAWASSPDC